MQATSLLIAMHPHSPRVAGVQNCKKKEGTSPGKDQVPPKEEDATSDEAQGDLVRRGAKILAPGIDISPTASDTGGGDDCIPTTPPSPSYAEIARKPKGKSKAPHGGGKGPKPKAPTIQSFREKQAADMNEVRDSLVLDTEVSSGWCDL